jgi:hypothetical protein
LPPVPVTMSLRNLTPFAAQLRHGAGQVGDLEGEAVPAAGLRHRAVRHRLAAPGPAAWRAEHQAQVTTRQHREGRGGMHHLGEAQLPGVERDRGVDIVDDVPHAYRGHPQTS